MKLLVIGYYGKGNLGDDSYKTQLGKFFPSFSLTFISSDLLKQDSLEGYYGVIVGGGDVINPYFNGKLRAVLPSFTGPKIAFSIGVPFESLVTEEYFSFYDRVFIRNFEEVESVRALMGRERVDFTPDVGFCEVAQPQPSLISKKEKVAVFPVGNLARYPKIVRGLSVLVAELAKCYDVALISFNPSEDVHFCEALCGRSPGVTIDRNCYTAQEMVNLISTMKFTVCMRYHAHVYSVCAGTPVLSLSATKKTRSLMKRGGLEQCQYEIPLDGHCSPTGDFSVQAVMKVLSRLVSDESSIRKKIGKYDREMKALLKSMKQDSFFLSRLPLSNQVERLVQLGDVANASRLACSKVTGRPDTRFSYGLMEKLKTSKDVQETLQAFSNYYISLLPPLIGPIVSEITSSLASSVILDKSLSIDSSLAGPLVDDDFTSRTLVKPSFKSKFYLDLEEYASYDGVHRGGWYLACQELAKLPSTREVYLDMYVDRTFLWATAYLEAKCCVPYTVPWAGFIHHTDEATFTTHTLTNLFKSKNFIVSLGTCRGLIVLVESMRAKVEEKLREVERENVRVFVLSHPIETPSLLWSERRFFESTRKMINVGAWMRNPFTIYTLESMKTKFKKFALRGVEMSQYFPSSNLRFSLEDGVQSPLESSLSTAEPSFTPCRPCRSSSSVWNLCLVKWLAGKGVKARAEEETIVFSQGEDFKTYSLLIPKMIESVKEVGHLPNDLYDETMADFVVFLDLFDAAAVNTVLECIVRHTPIIINRLPGTEDLLGKDYPLFFSLDGVRDPKVSEITSSLIIKAHRYLASMDKTIFTLDFFISSLASLAI